MKDRNKKILYILICASLIVISSIYLFRMISSNKKNNEQTEVVKDNDVSNASNSILSVETIKDLKENLGKGANGDVTKIDQSVNEKGEKQYIITHNDGSKQTITIRDIENDGEGSRTNIEDTADDETSDSTTPVHKDSQVNPINPSAEDEQSEQKENDGSDEIEQLPKESLGTVFERYCNMTSREQYAFYKSFASRQEYLEWYAAAEAEYAALHPTIEVGSNQEIDFSDN